MVSTKPDFDSLYRTLAEYLTKLGRNQEAIEAWQGSIAAIERRGDGQKKSYQDKVAEAREQIAKLRQ